MSLKHYLQQHQDSITSAATGTGAAIGYVLHTAPGMIIGKIFMTVVIAFLGGVFGYLGKRFIMWMCGDPKHKQ